ncbi:MAG: sensor histidine kinase [Chloroflexota bacterium]
MAYVTVGLIAMFGVVAILGFGTIDQATQLVYAERLATAHTTASIIERDFERLVARAREEAVEATQPLADPGSPTLALSAKVLEALVEGDVSPFFRVRAVWRLDASGTVVDSAAALDSTEAPKSLDPSLLPSAIASAGWAIVRSDSSVTGAQSFASVYVPLNGVAGAGSAVLVVDTISLNSSSSYVPAAHGRATRESSSSGSWSETETYHLEVVDARGIAILGVGPDEQPGRRSPHAAALAGLIEGRQAAALLHEPGPGESFDPHVMAAVPLAGAPFHVVLEQPVDVALALPRQLRERLLLWIAIGLLATLIVAWVTTRHVVKPTEELTMAAERMAGGDLASPVAVQAEDEIGQLAGALEVMRERLGEAYQAVEETNRELEKRVAERTARLGQLLQRTISAQEDERQRLARELHDETAQTLTALSIAVDRIRDSLPDAPPRIREQVQLAREMAARLLAETRRLMLGLRPMLLDDLGLLPAIRWLCESNLAELDVVATVEGDPGAERLPAHIEGALFRIVQEAISNIAHHARAQRVQVRLVRTADRVTVEIVDDGRGFETQALDRGPAQLEHMGLIGMRERVALLGGSLEIISSPGRGTRLLVDVPLSGLTVPDVVVSS